MPRPKPVPDAGPVDAEHEALRVQALEQLDDIHRTVVEARTYMRSYQAALEKTRRSLREGGQASDMPGLFDVGLVASSFSERLNNIEKARSATRMTLWRMQAVEGMTNAQIARGVGLLPPARVAHTRAPVQGCERGDSNSHLFRDRDLNPARLPVPPRSRAPSSHLRLEILPGGHAHPPQRYVSVPTVGGGGGAG